jgi:invasion protein IalB
MRRSSWLWAALFASDAMAPALAQNKSTTAATAPTQTKETSSSPERTTASFGDWVLRCERPNSASLVERPCEVTQTITIRGQQAPIAEIAFGHLAKDPVLRATLVLPVNVMIAVQPELLSQKGDPHPLKFTWQRCIPAGCFASAPSATEMIATVDDCKEPGSITFKDSTGKDIAIPLSFRGLQQALAALNKEQSGARTAFNCC